MFDGTHSWIILNKLAEKLVEPIHGADHGDKTIGEWRKEITDIHIEIINFVRDQRQAEESSKRD